MKQYSLVRRVAQLALIVVVAHPMGAISRQQDSQPPSSLPSEPQPITFRLATDVLPTNSFQIANGIRVTPSDWPTLIVAQLAPSASYERASTCTGTFVGPGVILTAAHCVDDPMEENPRPATLNVDGISIRMFCEIHPAYLATQGSEDYALCLLHGADDVSSLTNFRYEVIDASRSQAAGTPVLMIGYGCGSLRVVGNRIEGDSKPRMLRIGNSALESAAGYDSGAPAWASIRSRQSPEPALCPGDSGGPLFSGADAANTNGKRRVVGVNSAVDHEAVGISTYQYVSFVSMTSVPTFSTWTTAWLERNQAHICGFNKRAGAYPCRK